MVTLNTIKEAGLATASALGGAASIALNNSIGAAVHAIVETNQYLKKSFKSPLLRAAVAAGVGAAAYLHPRAVTASLIALSALKFGTNKLNPNQRTIRHVEENSVTPEPNEEEKQFEVRTPGEKGSKANPIEILDNVLNEDDKTVISRYNQKNTLVDYFSVKVKQEEITAHS